MHPNHALIEKLYTSLEAHLPEAMAECYTDDARFRDLAFDLTGKRMIRAMWAMICQPKNNLRAEFEILDVNDQKGYASLIDDYVLDGRPVRYPIKSEFEFRDGLIVDHKDTADPILWANMAFGGIKGFLAGRFRFLRSRGAMTKLKKFVEDHPEYRW